MSPVQVSRRLPRGRLRDSVETNLRLVEADDRSMVVQRVRLESTDRCPDLRQKVCSRLRNDGRIAVPSPWDPQELILAVDERRLRTEINGDGWHARLAPSTELSALDLTNGREVEAAAELLQKALVVGFEAAAGYWWLSESARHWYHDGPAVTEDSIVLVPRLSLATCVIGTGRLGVVFDGGHMVRTEHTVAEFLSSAAMRGRFEHLRRRSEGRRGTFIYNTGKSRRTKCYFNDFANEITCGTSGVIAFGAERFDSLFDYYRLRYPKLAVTPEDAAVSVSFEWGKRPVLVAAKLLHMRLRLDPLQLPPRLRRLSMSPTARKRYVEGIWTPQIESNLLRCGGRVSPGLWRPEKTETEQLRTPELIFGGGERLASPREQTVAEYRRYFRERERLLRENGVYRFESTVPREIWIVVPPTQGGWTQAIQNAFVESVRRDLEQLTKQRFSLRITSTASAKDVAAKLPTHNQSTCLVVFDDSECDGANYYLLSEALQRWRLKRVTRSQLQRCWTKRQRAAGAKDKAKADQNWNDLVFHTVLDLLDQMGSVPWRIDKWPYDGCLAIDVSQERRFCAVSFLLCRDMDKHPGCDGFWRYVESWTKPDTKRETIDAVRLEDKVAGIIDAFPGSRLSPMGSLLVLRDGRECGDEPEAIQRGLNRWIKQGVLSQSARIDLVDYHKRTIKDLRMWRLDGDEVGNVLEGRAVYLRNAALVCTTGAGTLGESATADPCLLVGHEGAEMRRAAEAVFALSQHNYLSPKRAYRDAQPMRDADHELKRRMAMEVRLK